jgi:hypothetical protein
VRRGVIMHDKKEFQSPKIKYCPSCGYSLEHPHCILNEFWIAEDTAYYCWCQNCKWSGEVINVTRIITTEPEE